MEIVRAGQEESAAAKVKSDILKSADEAQIEASAELVLELRVMVNNPATSDVVFVCKDGERVQASRMLLVGRSAVLKSMLMNGMAESNSSEIQLPETSSSVLLSVFEFLYTGTLLDYRPQDWRMACEVLIASQFFLLTKLERITRKFMHVQISSVATDLSKVALMLTEAVEVKAMCENTDVNLRELVSILSSDWSDPDPVQNLSENALHYLLANSKGNCEDNNKLEFEEYLRFRQVVRWYIYSSPNGPSSDEEFLNSVVPDEKRALSLCIDFDSRDRYKSSHADAALPSDIWNFFLQDKGKESRLAVLRLMSHIDCRRMHPILLAKVVEPMKIISAEQIMSSLWYHTLRRTMIFKRLEIGWEHGESYRVADQGKTIERTGNKIGLAVATEAMSRPYGVYKWGFHIQQQCGTFAELGFIHFADGVPDAKGKLNDERLSDLDHARVLCLTDTIASGRWTGRSASVNWTAGRRVDCQVLADIQYDPMFFSYDASEHTCSLSLGGKDQGAVWKNLPSGTYYPAVCLGNTYFGSVRIELVSGFDLL